MREARMERSTTRELRRHPVEAHLHWQLYLALQQTKGRPVRRCMAQLERWERLDSAAFDALRRQRLARALTYARERVPLYRSGAWEEALAGRDARELAHWPVLERPVLQARHEEALAQPLPGRVIFRSTSGSTGRPLRVVVDGAATAWARANDALPLTWHGVLPGSRTLAFGNRGESLFAYRVRNQRFFTVADLSAGGLADAVDALQRWRPTVVLGFPSVLLEFARAARAALSREPLPLVPIAKVFGETLHAFQRSELERLLGARVLETYGSTETSIAAHECPAGSLHVLAPHVEIEILRADGTQAAPDETGDIVLTCLTNRAMPIVRYRIGDRGRMSGGRCQCGRPHPVLAGIEGRVSDVLLASDGTPVHSSAIIYALWQVMAIVPDAIAQVRFEQESPSEWTVLLQPGAAYTGDADAHLARKVRDLFGEECAVVVRRVDAIPRDASGKFRFVRPAPERLPARVMDVPGTPASGAGTT